MRAVLLAALVGAAQANNCGGSLSVDPRYCTLKDENDDPYCTYNELVVGDTVPIRIVVTNNANFEPEGYDVEPVYVPGKLVTGKTMQIAFACLDGNECDNPSGDALAYSGRYEAKGAPSTFAMGPAGPDFENIDHCDTANAATACGTITLTADVPLDPEESITIGVVYMTANQYVEESMLAHVAATSGFLLTTGGICQPSELSASGAGTAECLYLALSPPPPSPPPPPPPHDPPPPPPTPPPPYPPQCTTCHQAPCATFCADCVYPWSTPACIATCNGCEICKVCESEICKSCLSSNDPAPFCDACSSCVLCASPPPPPPPPSPPPPPPPPPPPLLSPPPPPPPPQFACIKYNKCHKCTELPAGACLYAGEMDGSCITTCDDLPEEWKFFKKWGACSSMCPVSVSKDPHLHLPHGGRADFRGQDNTVFNLLSAKDVTFNVLFEKGDFAWATRLVHGTKMRAGYWVIKTSSGKTVNIEYTADKFDPTGIVHEEGHSDVQVRAGTPALVMDDVIVSMVGKTLSVRNSKWLFTATTSPYPFGKLETNKNKVLLDVAMQPLYDPDTDAVAPHGILGQAYDQDKIAVDGKLDEEKTGETTTTAQAEGAIEGTWEEYVMADKFATQFKYARFGLEKAAPRDVSKLTGRKKAAVDGAVGIADLAKK